MGLIFLSEKMDTFCQEVWKWEKDNVYFLWMQMEKI
jgi:hypothetical protein